MTSSGAKVYNEGGPCSQHLASGTESGSASAPDSLSLDSSSTLHNAAASSSGAFGQGLPPAGGWKLAMGEDPTEYSPEFQDEYRRLWHEAAAERDHYRALVEKVGAINALRDLIAAAEPLCGKLEVIPGRVKLPPEYYPAAMPSIQTLREAVAAAKAVLEAS